jgi:hypothetical protein
MMGQSQVKQRQRWKMTANEVMAASVLIPGNEWHPLDGGKAPEYIPEAWDGPHCGLRLIEGFKTLACLPDRDRHTSSSGFWPETWAEWGDELAQVTADTRSKEIDAANRNRVRERPTSQAVSRMEIVLMWPAHFLASQGDHYAIGMARIVQTVAMLRAREYDLEKISRKLRMGARHVRRVNREGLDAIAAKLRMRGEPVF